MGDNPSDACSHQDAPTGGVAASPEGHGKSVIPDGGVRRSRLNKVVNIWDFFDVYDYDWSWWDEGAETPRAPRAQYEGSVAPAPSTVIDVHALQRDYPHLVEHFQWLNGSFLRTMLGSQAPGGGKKPPLNQKLLPLVEQIVAGHIAEGSPRTSGQQAWCHAAFTVPKSKPGQLRFILACKELNAALRSFQLPACILPRYADIVRRVLQNKFFVELDLTAYFFQFPLDDEAKDLFSFRVGSKKYRMNRAAMGFRGTPQVGQAVACAIATEAVGHEAVESIVWLDNFIFAAEDAEAVQLVEQRFLLLCKKYGVTVGDRSSICQAGAFLGVDFDLLQKRWRMDPAWTARLSALQHLNLNAAMPLRRWWRLFGMLLWRTHVLQLPLHSVAPILRWMSTKCRGRTMREHFTAEFWDSEGPVPEEVRLLLAQGIADLLRNEWRVWKELPSQHIKAFTDASLKQWCFIIYPNPITGLTPITQWGFFPPPLLHEDIFVKEAYALGRLISFVSRYNHPVVIDAGVDNTGVIGAWNKGFTLNNHVLDILITSYEQLRRCGAHVLTEYVKSLENPADAYTRDLKKDHPFFVTN